MQVNYSVSKWVCTMYIDLVDDGVVIYTGCPRKNVPEFGRGVPYVNIYRYNPKHLCPKLNGYGDNGQRKVWSSCGSTHCTCQLTSLIAVCS